VSWNKLRNLHEERRDRRASVAERRRRSAASLGKVNQSEDRMLTWHPHGSDNQLLADASDLLQHMGHRYA
tara:strand:- start:22 stop:231 length:210 start_codon:yes stop_codon:yes gene_type:complete